MLKVPVLDTGLNKNETETATKYILANTTGETTELEATGANGQIVPPITWITELGKQLLKAASEGNSDGIKQLMSQGAPFTADWLGTSPLHLAAQNNHLEVCQILLRAGISKDARTKVDRTPLHMAAYNGHYEVVECLITHGAEINCKDLLGMTPLHWAIQNAHTEVVSLLIRYGADTQVTNKFDLSPFDIAMQVQKHEIADMISMAMTITNGNEHITHITNDSSNDSGLEPTSESQLSENESTIPIETILLEDLEEEHTINTSGNDNTGIFNSFFTKEVGCLDVQESQNEIENVQEPQESTYVEQREDFAETVKLLQQHGITMLPPDDSNIFTSVMDSGHQVVLTEIGKEMLNSTKPVKKLTSAVVKTVAKVQKQKVANNVVKAPHIITVTPEEFLAMTTDLNSAALQIQKVEKQNVTTKPTTKRIVMKKNKVMPVIVNNNNAKVKKPPVNVSDMEVVMSQLLKVRRQANTYKKQAEEYKSRLLLKEAEAKMYKQKLLALQQSYEKSCS